MLATSSYIFVILILNFFELLPLGSGHAGNIVDIEARSSVVSLEEFLSLRILINVLGGLAIGSVDERASLIEASILHFLLVHTARLLALLASNIVF